MGRGCVGGGGGVQTCQWSDSYKTAPDLTAD